jgi:hypothetical protein
MTNPTSNFGWQMPTPTDLVTDLPADFEVFGQAVDTSLADLQGGTTGQILSKTTNADMDFTWITNDVGDITAVNVTSPITGGGSSGAVTIGINAATTSVVGAVQLSDSTSTTSSVLASTPTATKSAYDLADAAVPKSTVTTAGDVIYGTGSAAVTRLGIGTAGQVLKVNSGATAPEWGNAGTFVGCRLYKTAAQTIANTTTTSLTWDAELYDTDSFHNNVTNNSRITIPSGKGGKYLIGTQWTWAGNTTSYRIGFFTVNGTQNFEAYGTAQDSVYTGRASYVLMDTLSLSAGDYVEVKVLQNSGGNLALEGGNFSNGASIFYCVYLGA